MARGITIKIAGSEHSLVASSPEMERMMRIAAEKINRQLAAFDAKFPNKSREDKMAFIALNETLESIKSKRALMDAESEAAKLQGEVEAYLKTIE